MKLKLEPNKKVKENPEIMGCDYCITTSIVVCYSLNGKVEKKNIYESDYDRRWIGDYYSDADSDDDYATEHIKRTKYLEKICKEESKVKILFENGEWKQKSYETKHNPTILKELPIGIQLIKVYKNTCAYRPD